MNNNICYIRRIIAIAVILSATFNAMAFDKADYKEFAENIRKEVWAKDLPEFNRRDCPERLNSYSCVVIAQYEEYNFGCKKTFLWGNNLPTATSTSLCRQMVRINDKSALEKFSKFDFTSFSKNRNILAFKDEYRVVMGVKIYKPDGTVKEIKTDDFITESNENNNKKQKTKIAIPGLEVNDIIDLFFYTYHKEGGETPEPTIILLRKDYPVLSYKLHFELSPNYAIQYKCLNGAPNFTEGKSKDGNITLDLKKENIEDTCPEIWFDPSLQAPFIVLTCMAPKNILYYTPLSMRKKGLKANPDVRTILKDDSLFWQYSKTSILLPKDFKKTIKETDAMALTEEEKADRLYQYLMAYNLISSLGSQSMPLFSVMLDKMKIKHEYGITTADGTEQVDLLTNYNNTIWFIKLNNGGKIYYQPNEYLYPGEIAPDVNGRKAVILDGAPLKFFYIPETTPEENSDHDIFKAVIDGNNIKVQHKSINKGIAKSAAYNIFSTKIDRLDSRLDFFPEWKEKVFDIKKEKDRLELEELVKDSKERQKEYTKEYLTTYYNNTMPSSIDSLKIVNYGYTKDNPAFVYETAYTIGEMVRNAGPNLMVSIGKFIGNYINISGKDRERKDDIQRATSYKSTKDIELQIPDGYYISEESLAKLNRNISNDCMSFCVKAKIKNNCLLLNTEKIYRKKYYPAADWNKILDVTDKAYQYITTQVVLKKKTAK